MNQKKLKIVVITLTIISTISMCLSYLSKNKEACSIGIIGSVDGPTAFYIAKKLSRHFLISIRSLLPMVGVTYLFLTKE